MARARSLAKPISGPDLHGWTQPPPTIAGAVESSSIISEDHYTHRESQILQLIASGHTDKEVAAAMGISPKTVGTHLARLYRRSGAHSRTEAVVAWLARRDDRQSGRALPSRAILR